MSATSAKIHAENAAQLAARPIPGRFAAPRAGPQERPDLLFITSIQFIFSFTSLNPIWCRTYYIFVPLFYVHFHQYYPTCIIRE